MLLLLLALVIVTLLFVISFLVALELNYIRIKMTNYSPQNLIHFIHNLLKLGITRKRVYRIILSRQNVEHAGARVDHASGYEARRRRLEIFVLAIKTSVLEELQAGLEAHLLQRRGVGLDADAIERLVDA